MNLIALIKSRAIDAPITEDDLLDVHQRLKHHQGPLRDLLPVTPGPG